MAKRKLKKNAARGLRVIILVIFLFIGCEIGTYYITLNKDVTAVEIHENDYYTSSDFGLMVLESENDFDNDGIDDYSDILLGAQKERDANPKYVNKYYADGYPPEGEGVCTDTIWRALSEAGYNLKGMISADIKNDQENNNEKYNIEVRDDNIDFRRVENQEIFLKNYAEKLSTDIDDINEFMPGDIVTFNDSEHIAIISDKRNANGIPYLIQNSDPEQTEKEEDVLEITDMVVTGHYRFTYSRDIQRLMDKI